MGDQIEDEVGDSYVDDEGIEDFYGDDTFKDKTAKDQLKDAARAMEGAGDVDERDSDGDDLDLDYS